MMDESDQSNRIIRDQMQGTEKCPFCDATLDSLRGRFCHRCKNQVRNMAGHRVYSYSSAVSFYNLVHEAYQLIFRENPAYEEATASLIEAKKSELTADDYEREALSRACDWGLYLCDGQITFNETGEPCLDPNWERSHKDLIPQLKSPPRASCNDEQRKALILVYEAVEKGRGIRAESLYKSCCLPSEEVPVRRYLRTIKRCKKEDFFVFISAVTHCKDDEGHDTSKYTIEYDAACELKRQLDAKHIGSFWWDAPSERDNEWQISSKIATGLALSSVFFGFVFDGASKKSDSGFQYDYLDRQNSRCFSKNLNYEFETFYKLMTEEGELNKFIAKVLSKRNVPSRRVQKLFSLGEPPKDDYSKYPYLHNQDRAVVSINLENIEGREVKIRRIVFRALAQLYDIMSRTYQEEFLCLQKRVGKTGEEFRRWFLELIAPKEASAERLPLKTEADSLFEIDETLDSTPGDYFFEYAIIDEFGESAKDHFTFFLERQYDEQGIASFNLNLVVKDWNQAFSQSKGLRQEAYDLPIEYREAMDDRILCKSENKLANYKKLSVTFHRGATDLKDGFGTTEEYSYDYVSYTKKGGKALISKNIAVGGTGFIFCTELRHQENASPAIASMTYRFSINLFKKEIVRYTIKAKKNKIEIRILSPIPSKGLKVRVFEDEYIPCLTSQNHVANFGGKDYILTLSRRRKIYTLPATNDLRNRSFRLRLLDDADRHFFSLHDESGIEPRTKYRRIYDSEVRQLHCPYCAYHISLPYAANSHRSSGHNAMTCAGSVDTITAILSHAGAGEANESLSKDYGVDAETVASIIAHVSPDKLSLINHAANQSSLFCVRNNSLGDAPFILPQGFERGRGAIVTMLGAANAGKSVFISRLFGIEAEEEALQEAVASNSTPKKAQITTKYIGDALRPFVSHTRFVEPNILDNGGASVHPWENKFLSGGLTSYCPIPYMKYVGRTDDDEKTINELRWLPFTLELESKKQKAWMSFYDAPGKWLQKMFSRSDGFKGSPLEFTDCVILLVNDAEVSAPIGEENGVEIKSNMSTSSQMLEWLAYKHLECKKAADGKIKNVALAIVLSKFDRFEREFNPDSAVRSTPPVRSIDEFIDSGLQRYIDDCSAEIESYLEQKQGHDDKSLLAQARKYQHHKFFAISSIGRSDSIYMEGTSEGKQTRPYYITPPRGIENVILWLAYQMGIID